MKLDDDDGIAAIAAGESRDKKKQKGKNVCHALNVAESIQDAQTGHPTRPQGESNAEACCRMHVEVFDRLRTQLGACFSILL
jgi:hypothetical protein